MAIGVLVLGESGTGKSYSMKNFSEEEAKVLSVEKPILPFRKKMEIVKTADEDAIIREMKNTKKKVIIVDDFQYILGVPMMRRSLEKGWDKFNEIQYDYFKVLDTVKELPDDTIVYFMSHIERLPDGNQKIKTIGNALDKYITIEGLFMIVLYTQVVDGEHYFITQNTGTNTGKSPEGMFPSFSIANDLKYVDDKIRNYYYMDGSKSDDEMAVEDAAVASDLTKEDVQASAKGRKARKKKEEPQVLTEDKYYRILKDNNVVHKHAGDTVPEGAVEITKEEFGEGLKYWAQGKEELPDFMNIPEGVDEELPFFTDEEEKEEPVKKPQTRRSRRQR